MHRANVRLLTAFALCAFLGCHSEPKHRIRDMVAANGTAPRKVAVHTQPSEPVGDRQESQNLFPALNGFSARYSVTADKQKYELSIAVQDVTTDHGAVNFALVYQRAGATILVERYRSDRLGVWRLSTGADGKSVIQPAMQIVKFPLHPGDAWKWTGRLIDSQGSVSGHANFLIDGPETLATPSGNVQAYRVAQKFTLGDSSSKQTIVNTLWLCPSIGIARQETDGAAQSVMQITGWHAPTPPAKHIKQ